MIAHYWENSQEKSIDISKLERLVDPKNLRKSISCLMALCKDCKCDELSLCAMTRDGMFDGDRDARSSSCSICDCNMGGGGDHESE